MPIPGPEAADGQLTAGVALAIRSFLTPDGVGGRSVDLRTTDRFGEDLCHAIASLAIGPEADKPSILAKAAMLAAVQRKDIVAEEMGLLPQTLRSLSVNTVRVVSPEHDV